MTIAGKCDVCRARKIKCNESKPICSGCAKGKRKCTYDFPNSSYYSKSRSIGSELQPSDDNSASRVSVLDHACDLELRSRRQAPSGQGYYHVLKVRKGGPKVYHASEPYLSGINSIPASIERPSDLLVSRWSYVIRPLQQKVPLSYGSAGIFKKIPARLGTNHVLDAAVQYTLDSHCAFITQSDASAAKAHRSGILAMRCLRWRITNCPDGDDESVPLSMMLMVTAEYYRDVQAYFFQAHALALARVLESRWTCGRWGELEQTLLQSIWLEEMEESVFAGTDSLFDSVERLRVKEKACLQTDDELLLTLDYVMEKMILIPRLLRYVREFASGRSDICLTNSVATLVATIYDMNGQQRLESFVGSKSRLIAAGKNYLETNPCTWAFEFPSIEVFTMTAFYYMYRMAICGIVTRLLDIGLSTITSTYAHDSIASEDVRAAECIGMCVEYALFGASSGPSYKAIRLHDPLVMAWGAWSRLERRAAAMDHGDLATSNKAERMKAFCKESLVQVMDIWHAPKLVDILEATSEAFTGGPTLPSMARRGQLADWQRLMSDTDHRFGTRM